jgi:hypothetical protein
MSNVLKVAAVSAGVAAAETDPNFNQTVLLLHGDGTNGAQNNTFLDGSTNNFTITRNGNTTQGTFSPFSLAAGEWSNYFDGSGDYLTAANNSAFALPGDFTIELWAYFNSNTTAVFCGNIANTGRGDWAFFYNSAAGIRFITDDSATVINGSYTVTPNQWIHFAVSRSGTSVRIFADGVLLSTTTNSSSNTFAGTMYIGSTNDSSLQFPGYMANLRLVKGTAVYTAAFTPPTAPLTAITNTSLLTCQSNRFVDNSTNAFAITRNGDVRVTPFSPFAPSAAYSASTNGGSGYFDGTGDYLATPNNVALAAGTGDFTIEFWTYVNSVSGEYVFVETRANGGANGYVIYKNTSNKIVFRTSATDRITSGTSIVAGAWTHIAVTRSGTSTKLFMNGVQEGSTYTDTENYSNQEQYYAAFPYGTPSAFVPGYMSGIRFVKGTALTISVPTAPLTAISGTSILLNFTNAGIFDNTGKNNLETVGDAQIDTGTKKYGTGSMEFDGTGDWLLMANTPDQQLGTGNFTIEFWVYLATGDIGSARGLVAKGTSTTGFLVSLDSSEKVVFTFTTSTITSSGAITTNAWNHIAVVREGTGSNQTKIYIGGTNDGTGTVSTDFNQTSVMYVGCNRTAGDPMKGFIDDLRITKGVARYTANFTAPTKAFPDQ